MLLLAGAAMQLPPSLEMDAHATRTPSTRPASSMGTARTSSELVSEYSVRSLTITILGQLLSQAVVFSASLKGRYLMKGQVCLLSCLELSLIEWRLLVSADCPVAVCSLHVAKGQELMVLTCCVCAAATAASIRCGSGGCGSIC